MKIRGFKIHPDDNIAVVICNSASRGDALSIHNVPEIVLKDDIPFGHKVALEPIQCGEKIYKYGFPIGDATQDIVPGEWVHTHNVATSLSGQIHYAYQKAKNLVTAQYTGTFNGYLRKNGEVGVRNEIWILPMVSCVNHTGKLIADTFSRRHPEWAD